MLVVAYDGTNYVGWQVQPNGVSVQQRLEEAWFAATQESVRIIASGRTDSGVHALAQVCSVATKTKLDCRTLMRALNAHTPIDISIIDVKLGPTGFHAIRDASRKTYRYQIQFGCTRNPLTIKDHWFCPVSLDRGAIKTAANMLIGEHDFASFQAAGSQRSSTVRWLTKLDCLDSSDSQFRYLTFELTCNGFLYNMVRNIVGTLIRVGQGSEKPEWVATVLAAKDRRQAGPTAPAHGLTLVSVEYDSIQFDPDPQ